MQWFPMHWFQVHLLNALVSDALVSEALNQSGAGIGRKLLKHDGINVQTDG